MKVAIPTWGERVSPVFDTAVSVLVVEFAAGRESRRYWLELGPGAWPLRVERLTASGVEVLLCGAVSRPLLDRLNASGIEVYPFRSGETEALLEAFLEDRISEPQYLMPGCGGKRRLRRWQGGGRRQRYRRRKDES